MNSETDRKLCHEVHWLPSGDVFPDDPVEGWVFFHRGRDMAMVYDGKEWLECEGVGNLYTPYMPLTLEAFGRWKCDYCQKPNENVDRCTECGAPRSENRSGDAGW